MDSRASAEDPAIIVFDQYEALWSALLSHDAGEGDTCEHEERFIAYFEERHGPAGFAWEVLEISTSVPAFLVNVFLPLLNDALINDLRGLLETTLPRFAVLIHVFDGPISDRDSKSVAAVAVFAGTLWKWGPGSGPV